MALNQYRSTTCAMSKATADKINGAGFKAMEDLGHFPATENPSKFVRTHVLQSGQVSINRLQVPYLLEAIEWIQKTRAD